MAKLVPLIGSAWSTLSSDRVVEVEEKRRDGLLEIIMPLLGTIDIF